MGQDIPWESHPAYLPPPIEPADQGLYDFHLAQDGTLTDLRPAPQERCGIDTPHMFTMTGVCARCEAVEAHTHQFTNHGTCILCGANEPPF
jgi:hypothetical protein